MKAIVVGAGTAGLAAAHTLKKNDVAVTCLVAGDFPGGRNHSIHKQGYTFDLGA